MNATDARPDDVPRVDPPVAAPAVIAWKTRLAIVGGGIALRVLGATWRVRVIGREAALARRAEVGSFVFLLWHGQMLPTAWVHRIPTKVIVSEHRDGEIIAQVIRVVGLDTVRGSSSRGGARALLECVRLLKRGTDIAITPDGPRGPRHSFAPGALAIAYRSGAPLVGIVAHVSRQWTLRTWDSFVIPKPFARITVLYTDLRFVQGETLEQVTRDLPSYAEWLEDANRRVAELARAG